MSHNFRAITLAALLAGVLLGGCNGDGATAAPPVNQPAATPAETELLKAYNKLNDENKKLLQADAERRNRQQILQGVVKRWLYVTAVVLALTAFFGVLARLLKNVPALLAQAFAFIGRFVHPKEIAVAAILAPAAFALAWYLQDIWWYAWATIKVLTVLGLMFASWQVCHRVHTGQWDFVGAARGKAKRK